MLQVCPAVSGGPNSAPTPDPSVRTGKAALLSQQVADHTGAIAALRERFFSHGKGPAELAAVLDECAKHEEPLLALVTGVNDPSIIWMVQSFFDHYGTMLQEADRLDEAVSRYLRAADLVRALPPEMQGVQPNGGTLYADDSLQWAARCRLRQNRPDDAMNLLRQIDKLPAQRMPVNFHAALVAIPSGSADAYVDFARRWLKEMPWDEHSPQLAIRVIHRLQDKPVDSSEFREALELLRSLREENREFVNLADQWHSDMGGSAAGRRPNLGEVYYSSFYAMLHMNDTQHALEYGRLFLEQFPDHPNWVNVAAEIKKLEANP